MAANAVPVLHGDLLSVERGIIVHGCNCQGVMGAGLAAAIAKKHPGVFRAYRRRHESLGGLRLGDVQAVYSVADARKSWAWRHSSGTGPDVADTLPEGLVVANAMTQERYGRGGVFVDYDAVSTAFTRVRLLALDSRLPVYFPRIGCGLAGGDWSEVSRRISQALGPEVLERSALVDSTPPTAGQRAARSSAVADSRERWRHRSP